MPKFLRYRCSTPQKQPAATVAVCVSDILRDCVSGVEEKAELVEKERKKREKRVEATGAAKVICRNSGDGGDVLDKWGRSWVRK